MQSKAIPASTPLGKSSKPSFEDTALAELDVLYRVAKRLTRDDSRAEDLVGQTFLQAAKAWASFDGRFPRSWLLRILQNLYRRETEQRSRRPACIPLDDRDVGSHNVHKEVVDRFLSERIFEELSRLPEEFQMAVALCDVECLTYAEASIVLEVPEGTVKSRLWRGRKMLRQRLQGLEEG